MNLQPYEIDATQEREELNDSADPDAPITVTITEIVAHSSEFFETREAALENAKHAALGILDALASWATGDS